MALFYLKFFNLVDAHILLHKSKSFTPDHRRNTLRMWRSLRASYKDGSLDPRVPATIFKDIVYPKNKKLTSVDLLMILKRAEVASK